MKIKIDKARPIKIMFLIPDQADEAEKLERFARIDEPLMAKINKGPQYKHPHIEIRKERK